MLLCAVFPSLPAPTKAAAAECRSGSWRTGQLFRGKGFSDEQKQWVSPFLGEQMQRTSARSLLQAPEMGWFQ